MNLYPLIYQDKGIISVQLRKSWILLKEVIKIDKREILCGRLLKVMMNKPYSAQTKAINKIGRQIKEYDDKYNIFTKTDKDIKVG